MRHIGVALANEKNAELGIFFVWCSARSIPILLIRYFPNMGCRYRKSTVFSSRIASFCGLGLLVTAGRRNALNNCTEVTAARLISVRLARGSGLGKGLRGSSRRVGLMPEWLR
jgi:hypothetical protein